MQSSEGSADPPSNNSVASWELLNEGNNKVVLWVPDHLVTHCAGCEREFWVALRKHHCRSCGKVYCHDCSSYSMPCPHQNLLTPVRVCKRCFDE
ncbi:hypothetical protein HELRODRAFT_63044 [Helobdella robusta]|uniref:FYVE-type domain-containing protein n=1 Tax=Helobdella robusta TaxID=6412 RepID=T1FXA2_HELRO|nr:hypothetical protein HELRODRAFT_63044 [Helobdella robusta]ESO12516.1 hypothetical protein HELRODRAFT_63044 [Helobdella robusta]